MQGKLSEIDIRSIMQLIELGQRTGDLFVESYHAASATGGGDRQSITAIHQSWFVFFFNGRVIYAGDSVSNLSRLRDYLNRYGLDKALDVTTISSVATVSAPEYGHLWRLLETGSLNPVQGRNIIKGMVYETMFDLLSLHQGAFTFETSPPLSPQLMTIEVSPLVAQIAKQIQEWKQLHPHIQSPDQCPVIVGLEQLRSNLKEHTFNHLVRRLDGKTSIRQMARFLNRDLLAIAKALYPYIYQGSIQLLPPHDVGIGGDRSPDKSWFPPTRSPRIMCIDDGATIRKAVEYILNQQGYEVVTVGDPVRALSAVFQVKPDLILCDIAMPELDGYEICAMLRKSTAFRQTPIVMLTGKDGFIDRVKARVVEATDYLTKPFGAQELITLIEKYIGEGRNQGIEIQPNLTSEILEDEVELTPFPPQPDLR
jgi:twitching motility two-component system response regulator PilG